MNFDLTAMEDILVCPKTHQKLVQAGDRLVSTSEECRLAYPIRDGIPVMLISEATELSVEEWKSIVEPE